MSTSGITPPGGGIPPIRPVARPEGLGAPAPAPVPATEAQVARAQDALAPLGLGLQASLGEAGADLSALVDEGALPLEGVLRPGSDPAAVAALQGTLNALGQDPPLVVDGLLGPKSTEAIRAYQASVGLEGDGVAGPNTKRALQATEALVMAAAAESPDEAAAYLDAAEALVAGIQPESEQATLQGQVAAQRAALGGEGLPEAPVGGAPLPAAEAALEAQPLDESAPPEAPPGPHRAAQFEPVAGAVSTADAPDAAHSSDLAIATREPGWVEARVDGELHDALGRLMDDEHSTPAKAEAAGRIVAELAKRHPDQAEALVAQFQASHLAEDDHAFAAAFAAHCSDAELTAIAHKAPAAMEALDGMWVMPGSGNPSHRFEAAQEAARQIPSDEAPVVFDAAPEAPSLGGPVAPESPDLSLPGLDEAAQPGAPQAPGLSAPAHPDTAPLPVDPAGRLAHAMASTDPVAGLKALAADPAWLADAGPGLLQEALEAMQGGSGDGVAAPLPPLAPHDPAMVATLAALAQKDPALALERTGPPLMPIGSEGQAWGAAFVDALAAKPGALEALAATEAGKELLVSIATDLEGSSHSQQFEALLALPL